eukprot:11527612-Alexandrium_andersonii.AAC.1
MAGPGQKACTDGWAQPKVPGPLAGPRRENRQALAASREEYEDLRAGADLDLMSVPGTPRS